MRYKDLYSDLLKKLSEGMDLDTALRSNPEFRTHLEWSDIFGIDLKEIELWMRSKEYQDQLGEYQSFLEEAPHLIQKVETLFQYPLPGEVALSPSLKRLDGFARYELGSHQVFIGIDHPRADIHYRRVILAHELSHVDRDHQPALRGRFNKPFEEVSRDEYLSAFTLLEHLVSEGLAVLFSEVVHPGLPRHVYTFHTPEEYQWCLENGETIATALLNCHQASQEAIWPLYDSSALGPGSAPWAHYHWAAVQIREWLFQNFSGDLKTNIIEAHRWPASEFKCFLDVGISRF